MNLADAIKLKQKVQEAHKGMSIIYSDIEQAIQRQELEVIYDCTGEHDDYFMPSEMQLDILQSGGYTIQQTTDGRTITISGW